MEDPMSVTLITGAGAGMGQATARLCARRGDALVLVDRDASALQTTAEIVDADGSGPVRTMAVDVSDRDAIHATVATAAEEIGPPQTAILCAGIHQLVDIADIAQADLQRMLAVNLSGVLWSSQAVLPGMIAGGGGSIVVVSSVSGLRGHPVGKDGHGGAAHYAASKGGVVALVRSMAREVGRYGVRVNAVAPGMIATPMNTRSYDKDDVDAYLTGVPLGRLGQPDEVADVLVFLGSEQSSYVTGQVLNVCGGSLTA